MYSKIFQLTWISRIKISSKISSLHSWELTFHHKVNIPKMSLVWCLPFNVFLTIYLPWGHVPSIFHFGRFETILVVQSCHYEYSNFWWQHQIIFFPLTKGTHTFLGRLNCFEFNLIFICLHITICSMSCLRASILVIMYLWLAHLHSPWSKAGLLHFLNSLLV
jgi:hypothetical protein